MVSENYVDPTSKRTETTQSVGYQRDLLPSGTSSLSEAQLDKLSALGKKVARRIDRLRLIFSFRGADSKKAFYVTKAYKHLTHASPEFIKKKFPLDSISRHSHTRQSQIPTHSITQSEAFYFNRLFNIQDKIDNSAFKEKLDGALAKSEGGKEGLNLLDKIDLIFEIEKELNTNLNSQHLTSQDLNKAKQLILKSVLKINLNQLSKIEKNTLSSAINQVSDAVKNKKAREIFKDPQAYEHKIKNKELNDIKNEISEIGKKFKELYTSRHPNMTVEDWNEFDDLTTRGKIENLVGEQLFNSMSRKIKEQFLTNMEKIYNESGESDEALASALTKYMRCHEKLESYDSNPEFIGDKQHLFLLQLPFKKGITIDFNEDFTKLYETYKTKGAELTKSLKAKFEIQNSEIPKEAEIPKGSQRVYQFIKQGYSDYAQYAQHMYQTLERRLTNKDNIDSNFNQFTQYEMLEGYEQAARALKNVVDTTDIQKNAFEEGVNNAAGHIQQTINTFKKFIPNTEELKQGAQALKSFSKTAKKTVRTVKKSVGKFIKKLSSKAKTQPSQQIQEDSELSTPKNEFVIYNKKLNVSKIYEEYAPILLEGQIKTTTDLAKFAEEIKKPEAGLKFIRGLCEAYSAQKLSPEQIEALNAHASVFSIGELPETITKKLKMISPAVNLLKKNHGEIINLISALVNSIADEAELARLNPKDKTNLFINLFKNVIDIRKAKVLEQAEKKAVQAAEEETIVQPTKAKSAKNKTEESIKTETDKMSDQSSVRVSDDDDEDYNGPIYSEDDPEFLTLSSSNLKTKEEWISLVHDDQTSITSHASLKSQKSDKIQSSKIKKSPKLFKLPNISSSALGIGGVLATMVLKNFRNTISSALVSVISNKLYPQDLPSIKELKTLCKGWKKDPNNNELIGQLYSLLPEYNALLAENERVQLTSADPKDLEIALMTAANKVQTQLEAKRKSLAIALKPLIQPIFNKFLETHQTQDLFKYIIPIYTKLSQVDCDDVKKQEELYSALASFCGYVFDEIAKEQELIENIFSLLEEMSQKPVEVK